MAMKPIKFPYRFETGDDVRAVRSIPGKLLNIHAGCHGVVMGRATNGHDTEPAYLVKFSFQAHMTRVHESQLTKP